MKLREINWGLILTLLLCVLFWAGVIWFVCCITGCTQRQVKYYEYDENTGIHREWCYKRNSFASKEVIDWLYLDLFGKGSLYFGSYVLDNDSFKGGYGPAWFGTTNNK